MASNSGIKNFDYGDLLASPLKKTNIWTDLAEVCNKVLVREVEEKRRRLVSTKDSTQNRRGDILSQIKYLPETDKPARYMDTGEIVSDITIGDLIPQATVIRVINNGNRHNEIDAVDYFEMEWKTKTGRIIHWFLPTTAPQDRSQLIKNAYTLGFDFFNTNLSNKDYERLYEYLNMFFNENGFDDTFIKFIGFVKNLRLDLLPLWSFDDGTDYLNILKTDNGRMQHASKGGSWFLTSHVEIRFNLKDQNKLYPINTDEIEELFYLFAPIMLVLERIVGYLDAPMSISTGLVGQVEVINYGIQTYETDHKIKIPVALSSQILSINYGVFDLLFEETVDTKINLRSYSACQCSVVLFGIFEDYSDWEYYGLINPLYLAVDMEYPNILGYKPFAQALNIPALSGILETTLSLYGQDFNKRS